MLITFEGIEGSGKSTQVARLAAALRERGDEITTTREPGGTAAGVKIRRMLTDPATPAMAATAELFLYLADRADHIEATIRPALAGGRIVLCDRFSDSTLAYQGFGRGLDLALVRRLDAIARNGILPNVTFLLDCPVAVGLRRTRARLATPVPEDRFEREPEALHERVRAGFLQLAREEPRRFVVLDACQEAATIGDRIIEETVSHMGSRGDA